MVRSTAWLAGSSSRIALGTGRSRRPCGAALPLRGPGVGRQRCTALVTRDVGTIGTTTLRGRRSPSFRGPGRARREGDAGARLPVARRDVVSRRRGENVRSRPRGRSSMASTPRALSPCSSSAALTDGYSSTTSRMARSHAPPPPVRVTRHFSPLTSGRSSIWILIPPCTRAPLALAPCRATCSRCRPASCQWICQWMRSALVAIGHYGAPPTKRAVA